MGRWTVDQTSQEGFCEKADTFFRHTSAHNRRLKIGVSKGVLFSEVTTTHEHLPYLIVSFIEIILFLVTGVPRAVGTILFGIIPCTVSVVPGSVSVVLFGIIPFTVSVVPGSVNWLHHCSAQGRTCNNTKQSNCQQRRFHFDSLWISALRICNSTLRGPCICTEHCQ